MNTNFYDFVENNCVRIDWKAGIVDAVFAFNERWKETGEIFNNKSFSALIENYNAEVPEDFLPAIGQELSTYNFLLYCIEEDSDSYCIVLIPVDKNSDFEKLAKQNKTSVKIQKQPRKKPGESAKRINLSKQIPFDKQLIKGDLRLKFPYSSCEERIYSAKGGYLNSLFLFYDATIFPLTAFTAEGFNYTAFSAKHQLFCAIFEDDRNGIIKVTKNPKDINSWETINYTEEKFPILSSPFFINDDLIILHERKCWIIENAASGNRQCKKIFEAQNTREFSLSEFPKVIELQNKQFYVLLYCKLYKWENKTLLPSNIPILKHSEFKSFATENSRFVYVAEGILVEVDTSTKKTRTRSLLHLDSKTSVQRYSDEWAVFTRYGYTSKSLDIAQFWHPKTDTWIRMPLGKIGKFGISGILLHPNGYTLVESDDCVIKIDNLLETLKSDKKNILTMPAWSENWEEDSGKVNTFPKDLQKVTKSKTLDKEQDKGILSKTKALFRK